MKPTITLPKPEHLCKTCKGTGRNEEATRLMKEKEPSLAGFVRCKDCNGNGTDPVFNYSWDWDERMKS
jgi:DnaJ-class molecular chaperone